MRPRKRKTNARFLTWPLRAAVLLGALYGAGLVIFLFALPIPADLGMAPGPADAIVALTGESRRLSAALALLEQGTGRRLLITGVNRSIGKNQLRPGLNGGAAFDCCADLGFEATDTRGNARETAAWAELHGYESLVVVTGNDHMPRSLLEFAAAMPNIVLIPYPVTPQIEGLPLIRRLPALNNEYAKYLASWARIAFASPAAAS